MNVATGPMNAILRVGVMFNDWTDKESATASVWTLAALLGGESPVETPQSPDSHKLSRIGEVGITYDVVVTAVAIVDLPHDDPLDDVFVAPVEGFQDS